MILMLLLCFVSTGVKADTNTQSPWTFWYWMYGVHERHRTGRLLPDAYPRNQ